MIVNIILKMNSMICAGIKRCAQGRKIKKESIKYIIHMSKRTFYIIHTPLVKYVRTLHEQNFVCLATSQ